ncbi:MAG: geranylgeranylglycerol-phosphate geranylgeranyltransferase [Tenacibaculum sp.]
MPNTSRANILFYKLLSLFSVVRGYNILMLVVAQYLAAVFIFSQQRSLKQVLTDYHLLYLVLASSCVVAAGYIINNFYDVKADLINRPIKAKLDAYLNQETRLSLYFALNFLGFAFGGLVSLRAAVFFACYIFGIWMYSHKLKKHPLLGLITISILTIMPFFVVFIHYKNFSKVIFVHACFLFLVIALREIIKDLENIQGAVVNNYNTFPVKYGEQNAKKLIIFLLTLTSIPATILLNYKSINYMKYYFYFAIFILAFVGFYLLKASSKDQYRLLHNLLKILLLIGVFSLLFIDKSLVLDKIVHIFH